MHELAEQFRSHLKDIWRYRWYAVVFAWIIALGGWIAIYLTPDRYEASARVHVDTESILRPLLAGLTVQPNVDQMVTMMGRTLISRPNVDKVIAMAEMDVGIKTTEEREQLITRLTKELSISSAGRENLYTIAYTDTDPARAKKTVQSLLTLFMEGALGDQRKDAESARHFIDEQLESYNDKLIAAEDAVTDFKRRHMGFMTGDKRDYYTRLVEAQTALSQANLDLKEAEDSRAAIKRQLAEGESIPTLLGEEKSEDDGGGAVHLEIDARIQALEQKVDGMRLVYTEQHPDIVSATRILDQLKEQRKAEMAVKRAEIKKNRPSASAVQAQDPVYQQLTVSLASAEANAAALRARVAEYQRRYAELRAAVDAVPQDEAEYTQLTRDYEVTKKSYENLLARRESAQISGDMEARSGVMDIRVIDPPQVPSMPKWPNRKLLMSLVLIAALVGGLGVAFLVSQITPTINDERRLRDVSGLPVLGTVVMARTEPQKARRTRGLVALLISCASLLSAYAAIMATLVLTASRI
ncbi:MAG: XrtA system polysaccharide chain length determinant [Betaproteobacteria bacterium]